MNLDLRPVTEFEHNAAFKEQGWWHRTRHSIEKSILFEVRSDGIEVARVELIEGVNVSHYPGVPNLQDSGLSIYFFEVVRREVGTGTRVVRMLVDLYPDRRLFAESLKESEGFWESLGWVSYRKARYRTLYLQIDPK